MKALLSTFLIAGLLNTAIAQHHSIDVSYKTVDIDGVEIFYREAGSRDKPTLLLLHGFLTSSHMFRNLIEDLKDEFYLVAPDYPGYGRSEQPSPESFEYNLDNMAELVTAFTDQLTL